MMDLKNRRILVFDLEVASYDFESHYDDKTKEYLLQYCTDDESKQKTIDSLVFSPFTSRLVAIAVWDVNHEKGCVLVNGENGEGEEEIKPERENMVFDFGDEKYIVEKFWEFVQKGNYNLFVTFNGREFDCPFIMLRSLILNVRPSFNLMKGSDFTFKDYHIDLLKEFTFNRHSPFGARRKFSLDFYCKQLGITSPKSEAVSGDKVAGLFENKEYKLIADYAAEDVIAEAELLKIWDKYLNF